jgi:nucleoside-diphosphate-sugar epimerase
MSVLITGGAGFIGSHLVDHFVAQREHVVVIDNLLTGNLSNLEAAISSGRVTFVFGDLTMTETELRSTLKRAAPAGYSAIYHLASPASPEAYSQNPWMTLGVNGTATMRLIDIAIEHRALMFFTSTSEIYGDPLVHPQPESYFGNVNPIGPRACYDEGKRFGEAAISVAITSRGLNGRIMRIFNCYGPRMDLGDGRVIPAFLSALRAGTPLPIHGDGKQTRSLTYIDDLIRGILTLTAYPCPKTMPVNFGSEDERTIVELAQELCEVAGVPFRVEFIPARPEDPQRRRPNITLAKRIGWERRITLREGLANTWAWAEANALAFV